jgi:hypothetical protein
MSEQDVVYLSSLPQHGVVPRVKKSQFDSARNVNGKFLICVKYLKAVHITTHWISLELRYIGLIFFVRHML